ncbi:hypothetical protein DEJ48_16470 [Streptomyces venezuelae]|uniref:Uncharacterized protein n=1 Tax=Streptomyces venezuelae TaxID=54571 RepID=A0A5P2BX36_STRVZ|nr:hypothetical protein [Streptomyces venezuelae]QES34787.1 hypothetical protein DEJ48_16470 [Streptomyces venezuelae]
MELAELRTLYDRLATELAPSEYEVVWQGPAAERPKQAASLGIDGPERLAELTVWDSGEAQLQLGDLADGHVTEERLRLADAGELAAAVDRMTAWVTGRDG